MTIHGPMILDFPMRDDNEALPLERVRGTATLHDKTRPASTKEKHAPTVSVRESTPTRGSTVCKLNHGLISPTCPLPASPLPFSTKCPRSCVPVRPSPPFPELTKGVLGYNTTLLVVRGRVGKESGRAMGLKRASVVCSRRERERETHTHTHTHTRGLSLSVCWHTHGHGPLPLASLHVASKIHVDQNRPNRRIWNRKSSGLLLFCTLYGIK